MKNKKGFTLIELLAVIVILAIIALIAVPIILNMIESARKSAARSAALGYVDSIEYYAGFHQISSDTDITGYGTSLPTMTDGKVTCKKTSSGWNSECSTFFTAVDTKAKGKKPETATIVISESGKVLTGTSMVYNGYTVNYDGSDVNIGGGSSSSNNNQQQSTAICKKATTLTSDGNTTYGTNTGSTLVSGYALDCNVDGTGYNHRFYYVTDLEENSNYAVLIYNSNTKVVDGVLSDDNTVGFAYATPNQNWHGPTAAIDQLPTISHWSNISLANTTRAIKAAKGTTYYDSTRGGSLPTDFSYAGKAARLLTYKELRAACDPGNSVTGVQSQGYLDNCSFLLENHTPTNIHYSIYYWLETPENNSVCYAWNVRWGASDRLLSYDSVDNSTSRFGVRPVIEVLKSKIDLN